MSITSGPINETEQASERFADHVGDKAKPLALSILDAIFERLWETRIVIDIRKRDTP